MPARYNAAVDLLERNATPDRRERPYLLTASRRYSYAEVIARARTFGAGLRVLGLEQGDRVLVMTPDSIELVCSFWGALRAGVIAVPITTALSAAELQLVLDDSEAKALVFAPSVARTVGEIRLGATLPIVTGELPIGGALRWAEVEGDPACLDPSCTEADDHAFWQYTSGTTGTPKAVMHRHGSLRAAPDGWARSILAMGPRDVILSVSRMFFSFGLQVSVFLPAAFGAAVVINDAPQVPLSVQGLIEAHAPTLLFGVATFYAGYARLPDAALGSVRLALSAGEPLPASLYHEFTGRFGVPLLDGLGSTEGMQHLVCNRPERPVPGSTGRVVDGYELEVRDPSGRALPEGERGELWVRGPTLFAGYWKRPELTARALVDGWLRTGDLVYVEDGHVYHEGRLDDLMKLGGAWVVPREIEDVLRGHRDVEEVAVVASDNGAGIPQLKAYVRSRRKDASLHAELEQLCVAKLPPAKVPQAFTTVEEFPRTSTGKIKRFELRSRAA